MKKLLLILFVTTLFARCVPYEKKIMTEINPDLQSKELQKIFSFQDQRLSDSLYQFFWKEDPTFRYPAALAFASIQDSTALDSLAALLKDPVDKVRAAAAFSIGQIGSKKGELLLFQAFDQNDTTGIFAEANAAILEAVGRCGTKKSLESLASISTYTSRDTHLLTGQAYGIYRFGLRKMLSEKGTEHMLKVAINADFPPMPRVIAANYLARFDVPLKTDTAELVRAFTKVEDPRVRMALATVVGKTKSNVAKEALVGLLGAEQDYRVKINMIRAMENFPYADVKDAVTGSLKHPNPNVSTTAAQYFIEMGQAKDASNYQRVARDSFPWQVKMKLNAAAIKHLPFYMEELKGQINYRVRRIYEKSTNPYEKAAALDALANYGWNYRYISQQGLLSDFPIVRTAAIQALAKICSMENFNSFFGLGSRRVRKDIAANLQAGITTGDAGVIYEAAGLLRDKNMNFYEVLDSLNFLDDALAKLKLPAEIETYNSLNKTIHKLNYKPGFKPKTPDFNNPIRFENLSGATDKSLATIKTKKGDIVVQLMPYEAPGSVANFARLARERFFNNKNFHRVVPNFVLQGGCSRGDGYGSLDYSIRSEFSLTRYDDEGYIGMASAGKDTEGTQFFITHSPTPHLDGSYTIFGKIVKGMSVAHSITQSDVIEKIEMDF